MAFGAPIPARLAVERELADIVLTQVLPIWQVREGLEGRSPDGWRLVDLHEVWLAGPALARQVVAADYRIELGDADPEALAAAATALLAAEALPRERAKGASTVGYDLRPLLIDIAVATPGPPLTVRTRTRFHPVLGTGRPEEVMAALSDVVETPLVVGSVVRERLILLEDLDRAVSTALRHLSAHAEPRDPDSTHRDRDRRDDPIPIEDMHDRVDRKDRPSDRPERDD